VSSLCIVDLHVAVNSIKSLSDGMATPERVPFSLLSSYKIVCTAVNNINILGSSRKMLILPPDFNQIWSFSTDFPKTSQ
jgi:hypothetical protein